MEKTTVSAILLAAGSSSRMGENKMLMRFCGKTPVELCVEAFCGIADEAVIAVSPDTEEIALTAANSASYPVKIVRGGKTRQESVFNAVRAASGAIAAVHDCARCLVDRETIKASLRAAEQYGCGIASVPVTDTVRFGDTGETLDRSRLLAAQTPQSFRRDILLNAYSKAVGSFTDDADLCRSTGVQLHFSPGSKQNLKLTTRDDIPYFEFLLSKRSERNLPSGNVSARSSAEPRSGDNPILPTAEVSNMFRIGIGEDTHRLAAGRKLILGGVEIPFELGLLGHSDADALAHAVIDALLGACALGDIGQHFPDSDEAFRGISSLLLAKEAAARIRSAGFEIVNIDSVITAQKPKLAPFREAMRANLAKALGVPPENIGVKFTTPEGTGPEGNLECITVRAVAAVQKVRIQCWYGCKPTQAYNMQNDF